MFSKILIILLSLTLSFSNFLIFKSYKFQKELLTDAANNEYKFQYQDLVGTFPNLALNSVPILTYLSRYDTNNKNFNVAIARLNKSLVHNPNSLYTKYLLARNYIYINNMINAESVLEDLFYESPNLRSSSSLYFAVLATNKSFPKLKLHFKDIKTIDDQTIWSFYLESLKSLYSDKSFDDFYYLVLEEYNIKFLY
jgi:hypothetical protein